MKQLNFLVTLLFFAGCGAAPTPDSTLTPTQTTPPATQTIPPVETQIEDGIYAGQVTCEYESRNTVQGLVEDYSYDFNETFVFNEFGLPNPGVAYNPDSDQVEFFGTVFDVTNRTFSATDSGYVENALLVGTVEGDRVNVTLTWTFTDAGEDAILYRLDISWTYRSSGVPWSILEECSGTLRK